MRRALLLCGLFLALCHPVARADPAGIALTDIATLPLVRLSVSFGTAKGPVQAQFAGPLLWALLVKDGAVDPAKPRRQAGQTVMVTGQDGYSAALSVGEISPDLEGKPVILATSMNGRALGRSHLRLVIPGDRKGARDVRDVVRVLVSAPAGSSP